MAGYHSPPVDRSYQSTSFRVSEIEHRYGREVHLVDNPLALTLLAELSDERTVQPAVTRILRRLYDQLARTALAAELPRANVSVRTRMGADWEGVGIDRRTKAVTVAIARAGTVPSQICFELLTEILEPAGVRQDHVFMARQVDPHGRVTGSTLHESKIGGDVDGRLVLLPDPMGATGGSLCKALAHYAADVAGTPLARVSLNLIVTPEFVRRVTAEHPGTRIWAFRLDRGLSDPDVLASVPGTFPDRERGLDGRQYIVPGAGGLGELLNNSWV